MRLTDEILTLSDKCAAELVEKSLVLGAGGRMGLFPSPRPFSLSVDISKDMVDVASLCCLGLTRGGCLVDVQYDNAYTNSFDTHVALPPSAPDSRYYLCVSVSDGWRDTNDGLCEPSYGFLLLEENTPVPDNALPIARIVYDEYCWRADETDFVPPCLYIASHDKYEDLAEKFLQVLRELDANLPQKLSTAKGDAVRIFWPMVQQLMIVMDKEGELMTPAGLLSKLQRLVSAFYCACSLDENIKISDVQQFVSFVRAPYSYRNSYAVIRHGVDLAMAINERIISSSEIEDSQEATPLLAPPAIEKGQLRQVVKYGSVQIKVRNNAPGATVYYTTDGSKPGLHSKSGETIVLESGFSDDWHKEPPRNVVINVVAYKDGVYSEVGTYEAVIRKGNPFSGKQI